MVISDRRRQYFDLVAREKLWTHPAYLQFYLRGLFRGVSLEEKKMLDIGGGSGLFSFYAACAGARRAVCLEPEAAGSTAGVRDKFQRIRDGLGTDNVTLSPATFQAYNPEGETYDVVLMHNSVNHLDEAACEHLHRDEEARRLYVSHFRKLYDMTGPGAAVIIADCSRYNFFNMLKLKNPLLPMIEWNKHQSPRLWSRLLCEAGFEKERLQWTSINRLGMPGKLLLGNRFAAFFHLSHFCLTCRRG